MSHLSNGGKKDGIDLSRQRNKSSATIMPYKEDNDKQGEKKKKPSKKRKKRIRGQKVRIIHVKGVGELPTEKLLKSGKVRHMNVLGKVDEDALPRKTREMLERMSAVNGVSSNIQKDPIINRNIHERGGSNSKTLERSDEAQGFGREFGIVDRGDEKGEEGAGNSSKLIKQPRKNPATESMGLRPGESVEQLSVRLGKERRQLVIDTVRKSSHQYEKKKAHYRKRQELLRRRKRQRRGCVDIDSDDDIVADNVGGSEALQSDIDASDEEEMERLNELPMYWQEVVRNNGKPVSEKKRRLMDRADDRKRLKIDEDKVEFGDRVDRPPKITIFPKERSKTQRLSRPS